MTILLEVQPSATVLEVALAYLRKLESQLYTAEEQLAYASESLQEAQRQMQLAEQRATDLQREYETVKAQIERFQSITEEQP